MADDHFGVRDWRAGVPYCRNTDKTEQYSAAYGSYITPLLAQHAITSLLNTDCRTHLNIKRSHSVISVAMPEYLGAQQS